MAETPSVSNGAQHCENERKNSVLNYESPALTAELQAHRAMTGEHPISKPQHPIFKDELKFRLVNRLSRIWDGAVLRTLLNVLGLALLSALILATRGANWQHTKVAKNVYFVDAEGYARMARVRMIRASQKVSVRHQE